MQFKEMASKTLFPQKGAPVVLVWSLGVLLEEHLKLGECHRLSRLRCPISFSRASPSSLKQVGWSVIHGKWVPVWADGWLVSLVAMGPQQTSTSLSEALIQSSTSIAGRV